MNQDAKTPDYLSPDHGEARLTALLLGELSAAESEAVRQAMAQDPQLSSLFERLKQTIELVQQEATCRAEQPIVPPNSLQMGGERRKDLLEKFKIVALPTAASAPQNKERWHLHLGVAAVLVALISILGITLNPAWMKPDHTSVVNGRFATNADGFQWGLAAKYAREKSPQLKSSEDGATAKLTINAAAAPAESSGSWARLNQLANRGTLPETKVSPPPNSPPADNYQRETADQAFAFGAKKKATKATTSGAPLADGKPSIYLPPTVAEPAQELEATARAAEPAGPGGTPGAEARQSTVAVSSLRMGGMGGGGGMGGMGGLGMAPPSSGKPGGMSGFGRRAAGGEPKPASAWYFNNESAAAEHRSERMRGDEQTLTRQALKPDTRDFEDADVLVPAGQNSSSTSSQGASLVEAEPASAEPTGKQGTLVGAITPSNGAGAIAARPAKPTSARSQSLPEQPEDQASSTPTTESKPQVPVLGDLPTLGKLFRPTAQNTWDESATPSAPLRAPTTKVTNTKIFSPARPREGQAATQIAELRPETTLARRPANSENQRGLSFSGGGQSGAAAVDRAGLAISAGVDAGGNAASNRAVNRGEAVHHGEAGGDQFAAANFDAGDKLSLSVDDRKGASLEAVEEKARVSLNKVAVNVAGTQGSRALVENITLEGEGKKFNQLITEQKDQLTDLASSVLAGKTLSDLEQPGARQSIRKELLSTFNDALGSDLVNEIHFTEPPETLQQETKTSLHEGLYSLAQEKDKLDGNTGLPVATSGAREAGEKADLAGRTSYAAMSPKMAKRYGLMPAAPPAAPATPAPAVVLQPTPPAARPAAPVPPTEAESVAQVAKPRGPAPVPQPEVRTTENSFSTFSLNVADVSFKLAASSLEQNIMPDPATVRSEEFINAFQYRDPEPTPGAAIGFAWEQSRYPFAHDRDLLRLSLRTASQGRAAERPLNVVLLLDSSGSMERADRVRIIQECLRVLAAQLKPADRISVITFSRSAHLLFDGLAGNQAGQIAGRVSQLTPQGGTNLEDALGLAYATARRHFLEQGINRVVLLTDGAANLGNVDPQALQSKVESQRRAGIALDCFGIGWEGYNDDLLEVLSRNGDGRYGFVNDPAEAASGFADQLAGALRVAASDVKVQVEFNAKRVPAYRQIGYAKHQLKKEQFRDNTVDAAELGAAETGNALYVIQVNAQGEGPIGVVRVRFKVPGTSQYRETEWTVNYRGASLPLEQASTAMRLAATASAFSEWLVASPFASEVTADRLLHLLNGVPAAFEPDPKPKRLEWMIRQAKSLAGR